MAIIIKTPEQIEGIRKSSKLAGSALKYIEPFIKAGVTTDYLNNLIDKFIRDNGGIAATLNYSGYPKSCCISVNDVVCHGIPSDYVLKNGDILNVDVTTILDGYFGDTSKMYTIGKISVEAKKLIQATKTAMDMGIKQVFPGNRFGNIGYEIEKYISSQGYSVVYEYCGHGVGIKFHEEPQVEHSSPKDSGPVMKPGMTFTIEPMINAGQPEVITSKQDGWTVTTRDGKLSAQFEHTILVTETGFEVLTDVDDEY